MKPTAAFLAPRENVELVFGPDLVRRVGELCTLISTEIDPKDSDGIRRILSRTEIVLSTWGMPRLDADTLSIAPHLKIVIYGASSVKSFVTDALFERNVRVTTAAQVNGRVVAEFALALITLSLKDAWRFVRSTSGDLAADYFRRSRAWEGHGGYHGAVIGVVGASSVGRQLLRLLESFPARILLYDPFVDAAEASSLGALKVELEHLMQESDVVTLHAPNLRELHHMIDADMLSRMKDGSWLVNTARGALVDQNALLNELRSGRISACLDVTDPEPPAAGSELFSLPNVILTPHMAGAIGADCRRMGDHCVEELERYLRGEPPLQALHPERLSIMG